MHKPFLTTDKIVKQLNPRVIESPYLNKVFIPIILYCFLLCHHTHAQELRDLSPEYTLFFIPILVNHEKISIAHKHEAYNHVRSSVLP